MDEAYDAFDRLLNGLVKEIEPEIYNEPYQMTLEDYE